MNSFLKKYLTSLDTFGDIFRNKLRSALFLIHTVLFFITTYNLINSKIAIIFLILGLFLTNLLIFSFFRTLVGLEKENGNIKSRNKVEKINNSKTNKDIDLIKKTINTLLSKFKIDGKIVGHLTSATITRFHIELEVGTKVSKLTAITNEISLALGVDGVRIAQVPGQQYIGIEIPNKYKNIVLLKDMLNSKEFSSKENELKFCLGMSVNGEYMFPDLSKLVHVLCGAQTGGGKSSFLNSLIISLISKYSPDELKIVGIDPKKVELNYYKDIPHLLYPIAYKPEDAMIVLSKVVLEMESRYDIFCEMGVRDIVSYNKKSDKKMARIVVVIDELFDLMESSSKETESLIARLASKSRACGISLVICTQKPTVNVCSGIIKSNMPSRISFSVASRVDSGVILDTIGAERLLGSGDGLISSVGNSSLIRFQGVYIHEEDIPETVDKIIKKYNNCKTFQNNNEVRLEKHDNKIEVVKEQLKLKKEELQLEKENIILNKYEKKVLDYIFTNSNFTVKKATSELSISPTKLNKALIGLREKNKIYQNGKQYLISES